MPSLRARRSDDDMTIDNLAALVPVAVLQQVQDAFSSAFGIPILFVSPTGGPLTRSGGIETFCAQLTRKIEARRPCANCGRMENGMPEAGSPQLHTCPLGLQDVLLPIKVNDSLVGYLITSQVSETTGAPKVVQWAEEHGMTPQAAVSYASRFTVASAEKLIQTSEALSAIGKLTSELALANHHRRWSETNDSLTGVANRTRFWECLTTEFPLSDTHSFPFSLLVIDVDDLKSINDMHGHETGDRVLATVGEVLSQALRASDLAGRYTSDSFLALLRGTDETGAQAVAGRLKTKIEQCIKPSEQDAPITISIGSVTYPNCAARDADSLVREACTMLRAERTGSVAGELPLAA